MTNHADPDAWALRLESLGLAVRDALRAQQRCGADMATAVAHEGGDTIFAIDRHVEPAIEAVIHAWPDDCKPLLVAEGFGADGRMSFSDNPRYRLIVDPIDGTRGIMYDKRAAWFLAGVAENKGESTTIADTFAAAMVELPTSKQGYADSFVAVRDQPTRATRMNLSTGETQNLSVQPSQADVLQNGFAQVSNFFPRTKVLAADLMAHVAAADGSAMVFDDQYISTGGQFVQLMMGQDRFCCDLRPLLYDIRGGEHELACHPYDIAALLVARQSGVIITDGFGRPLDAPLDVHCPVHWCGYANETLQKKIQPVITAWLRDKGIELP